MTKLNQLIAVEKGVKASVKDAVDNAYHLIQKPAPFTGITRTYRPRFEDGEILPPESVRVQVTADDVIRLVSSSLARLFDVVATKDTANTRATADIVVDGAVLVSAVPVTTLLFLEKQVGDLHTIVAKLPTLAADEKWLPNKQTGLWETEPFETAKPKKLPRNHVKWAPPTPEYTQPAQVEVFNEDVVVGYWTTVKSSGALPATRVRELVVRVEKLQTAIKQAREAANMIDVTDFKVGDALLDYVFEHVG